MGYNGIILATGAEVLADILRNKLLDLDVGAAPQARDENELLGRLRTGYPRLVFLEECFRGQGTEEFVQRTVRRNPDIRIAVWSARAVRPRIAARFILAGADSYFSLRDTDENLVGILGRIVRGRGYCPAEVKAIAESDTYFPDMDGKLTPRERQIVKLSAAGQSNREMAGALGIRLSTVKLHKANIYRKCGGSTAVDILRYGLSRGIICAEDLKNQE
jgi:DNA-binding NarL/FixJ family response regulator